MIFEVMPTPTPSIERYKELFLTPENKSITRTLQYEQITREIFAGKTLDVGGGEKAQYKHLLNLEEYNSINIDPNIEPTWVVQVGESFPCPQNHYDNVISMNTLEHVFDAKLMLANIFSALKDGGQFYCSTPFLQSIHGHPDDYFRPTPSWYEKTLSEIGFKDIEVIPLLWGPFSTGLQCSGYPFPLRKLRKHFVLLLDVLYAKIRFNKKTNYDGEKGLLVQNYALGYYVKAIKK